MLVFVRLQPLAPAASLVAYSTVAVRVESPVRVTLIFAVPAASPTFVLEALNATVLVARAMTIVPRSVLLAAKIFSSRVLPLGGGGGGGGPIAMLPQMVCVASSLRVVMF